MESAAGKEQIELEGVRVVEVPAIEKPKEEEEKAVTAKIEGNLISSIISRMTLVKISGRYKVFPVVSIEPPFYLRNSHFRSLCSNSQLTPQAAFMSPTPHA